MRDIYSQRVALEREFASKLQQLAKKASDKKSKKAAALVVGHETSKSFEDSVIAQRYITLW